MRIQHHFYNSPAKDAKHESNYEKMRETQIEGYSSE